MVGPKEGPTYSTVFNGVAGLILFHWRNVHKNIRIYRVVTQFVVAVNRVKCGGNRKVTRTTFMSPKEKAGEERIVDILSESILK